MLGEDPELLEAIVSNDDNLSYGASISVHTGPDDTITALTDDGIDEPKDMLTAARITTKTWHAFLDDFVDDQKIVTRIKAQSPREQSAGYAACRRMPAENLRAPVLSADGFGVRLTLTPKGIDPSAAGLPGAQSDRSTVVRGGMHAPSGDQRRIFASCGMKTCVASRIVPSSIREFAAWQVGERENRDA